MKWIAINLVALIAVGVALCAWVLHYTGAFPQVLGLLGLGGLFAWIAFLANLLHEDTKKALQRGFEENVLKSRKTLPAILVIGAVFFLGWAPWWGTLVVSTRRDDKDRTIKVRSRGEDGKWTKVRLEEQHLVPRSESRWALRAPWFGSREYQVKVAGLPARIVPVQPWWRTPLSVPSDFDVERHPLVLVHLSEVLNATIHGSGSAAQLQVFRNGQEELGKIERYFGEAVWVGGDADIEIPSRILTLWRLALVKDSVPVEALARWEPCRSIGPEADLKEGQRLSIRYVNPNGQPLVTHATVAPPYPQEVYIDEPQP